VAGTPEVSPTPKSRPSPRSGGLGEGAVASPTAGEAPIEEVPIVEIDLQDLYWVVRPDTVASKILESILERYPVDYRVLENFSPDVGSEYYDQTWKAFEKRCEKEKGDYMGKEDWLECARKYAKTVRADAVVYLFDGYESALALVWRIDEDSLIARSLSAKLDAIILSALGEEGGEEE